MAAEFLSWEISPGERKERVKKFLIIAGPAFISLVFFWLLGHDSAFPIWAREEELRSALTNLFAILFVITALVGLFFISNLFWPYAKRTYKLNLEGIKIAKGRKTRFYPWSSFECFYPYRSYQRSRLKKDEQQTMNTINKANQSAEGQIFYLQKKCGNIPARLYKTFIVVYSEPDNSGQVMQFLTQRLPKKKMTDLTDLGLVFYQFK